MKKLSLLVGLLLCSTVSFAWGYSASKDEQGNWHIVGATTRTIGKTVYYCISESAGHETCRTQEEMNEYLEKQLEQDDDHMKYLKDVSIEELNSQRKKTAWEEWDERYQQLPVKSTDNNTQSASEKIITNNNSEATETSKVTGITEETETTDNQAQKPKKRGIFKTILNAIGYILTLGQ